MVLIGNWLSYVACCTYSTWYLLFNRSSWSLLPKSWPYTFQLSNADFSIFSWEIRAKCYFQIERNRWAGWIRRLKLDWDEKDGRRSTGGYAFFFSGTPVSQNWNNKQLFLYLQPRRSIWLQQKLKKSHVDWSILSLSGIQTVRSAKCSK